MTIFSVQAYLFFTKSIVVQRGIHRIHKWRTRGKKLVTSHESEALEDKQKLQMKTFSELAECLARISQSEGVRVCAMLEFAHFKICT